MTHRKRKADDNGDENMSPTSSPAPSTRPLSRPNKKPRPTEIAGRTLTLPRLLETLDAGQLRTLLERICDRHPSLAQEIITGAPRPSAASALEVLRKYEEKLKQAFPYGDSSAEYTYYRIKEPLIALLESIADFTPHFLPPNELQPSKSLQYLDGATHLIHSLPDWDSQSYHHHKEDAYDDISKAWALVIQEAGKRAGGFNLHSAGWDQALSRHNERSRGRLEVAITAMGTCVGWMASGQASAPSDQSSILNQLVTGAYGAPVKVGPW